MSSNNLKVNQKLNERQIQYLLDISDEEYVSDNEEIENSDHDSDPEMSPLSDSQIQDYKLYARRGDYMWSDTYFTSKTPSANIFKEPNIGPKNNAAKAVRPGDAFQVFITDEIINKIVSHTNEEINRNEHKYSDSQSYNNETDPDEIRALFGLLFLSGLFRSAHENVRNLFATDGTGRDVFRATMSVTRFSFLIYNLRFDNKTSRESRKQLDKLAAISEIWNLFVDNCINNYNLSECVTVDEMLRAFRGRCGFKQYMPKKPAKYGIKIFILCDAQSNYIHNAIIYKGRALPGDPVNTGLSKNVVLDLAGNYHNLYSLIYIVVNRDLKIKIIVFYFTANLYESGRNITCDNWFTTFPLCEELLSKKLTLVGTLKSNKKEIPIEFLTNKQRDVNDSIFGFSGDMTLVSYVPKKSKAVILLSSMHHDSKVNSQNLKPEIINFYNSTKGGVDTVDFMCNTFTCGRGTCRWPLALFYCILDMAGLNAYITFTHDRPTLRKDFMKELGMNLILPHMTKRLALRNLPQELRAIIVRFTGQPEVLEPPVKRPKNKENLRCALCPKKDRHSRIGCDACHKHVCEDHRKIYCTNCDTLCIDEYTENN
jgi:hypothetical protein